MIHREKLKTHSEVQTSFIPQHYKKFVPVVALNKRKQPMSLLLLNAVNEHHFSSDIPNRILDMVSNHIFENCEGLIALQRSPSLYHCYFCCYFNSVTKAPITCSKSSDWFLYEETLVAHWLRNRTFVTSPRKSGVEEGLQICYVFADSITFK